MKKTQAKIARRAARHNRIRSRVIGSATKPRLAVFRSNKFMYVQLIDDESQKTIAAADTRDQKGTPLEKSAGIGKEIAKQAKAAGIEKVVFDRGGFRYQGAVKSLADSAREAGLVF